MNDKRVAKKLLRGLGSGIGLLTAGLLWLGAANRPFGTDPFAGSRGGDGFNIHVVDTNISETDFAILNERVPSGVTTAATYTYTVIPSDTTVMMKYTGSSGDTALVHITGIRPKRGGNSGTMKDSLSWYDKAYKINGGDSTATDSVLHMFDQAWVDSGMAGVVVVWAKGQSATSTALRKILPRRITAPIAHVLFGSHDSPLLEKVIYGVNDSSRAALFDSVRWSESTAGVRRNVLLDTLVGDTDLDTTRIIRIDGLKSMAAFITATVVDGSVAGGNYSLTLTPQVSIDSTNWTSVGPVFTQTASATATQSQVLFYTTSSGTAVAAQVATKAQLTLVDAALYYRWIVTRTVDSYVAGVSDSTFLNIRLARQHEPSDLGVTFELRQYPNIEDMGPDYTRNYVVRDRVHVKAGEEVIRDFRQGDGSEGMELPERCYIAVVAKGDDADRAGYVTLIGKRRARH